MDKFAEWIWNPFLSLYYLEMGVIFLVMTSAIACRKGWKNFISIWKDTSDSQTTSISHRKAFLSSLAATVGVGNLAGVATAIHLGGPGALFWMWVSAVFGMSFRLVSTYLTVKHQPKDTNALTFGTPMNYLEKFCKGSWSWVPSLMAVLILIKGNMAANIIQSNSVAQAIHSELGVPLFVVAIILSGAVSLVIVGGMKRIVEVSAAIAPWMVLAYLAAGGYILLSDPLHTLKSLGSVFYYAFSPYAAMGGVAGFTIMQAMQFGVSRGVFSHASGIGVAPFLQGANRDHPARGAYMAAFTPVVDTLLICTVTGLVILSQDQWHNLTGAYLTAHTFYLSIGGIGTYLVSFCLIVFAFTTIIGWAYYSEKCFLYLGGKNIHAYRWFFVAVTFSGPFLTVQFVWSMGDILIASLLLVHLLPLTYILCSQISVISKDLGFEFSFRKSVSVTDDSNEKIDPEPEMPWPGSVRSDRAAERQ